MFRLQDNVPNTYINQSRDFQLFCRLADYINNSVRFDIDTMTNVLNPMAARNTVLKLLAAKVGFFPSQELDDTMMRYIIATFPQVIKLKGTREGINKCVDTILRARNTQAQYSVSIDNKDHTIDISIKTDFDRIALEEYLKYIIPPGYITTMSIAQSKEVATSLDQVNIIHTYIDPNSAASQIASGYSNFILPSYSVNLVYDSNGQVAKYSTAGSPTIDVYVKGKDNLPENFEYYSLDDWDKLPNESSVTVWHYFEKDGIAIHQKVLTLVLPANNKNRDFSTITRNEVIGSYNDATYRSVIEHFAGDDSQTRASYVETIDNDGTVNRQKWGELNNTIDAFGRDTSDNPENWTNPVTVTKTVNGTTIQSDINVHLAGVFNDLLEQENNKAIILRVINSTQLFIFNEDPEEEKPFIGLDIQDENNQDILAKIFEYGEKVTGVIRLDLLDCPDGVDLEKSSDTPFYIIDNFATIATYKETMLSSSGIKYVIYCIDTVGMPPIEAQEDTNSKDENNEENVNG